MSTFYKVVFKEDVPKIFSKGLLPGAYVWATLKGARTFLWDESEDERLEGKIPGYRILSVRYSGRTRPDPDPDYPNSRDLEARVLMKSVSPARIKLIGF